MPCARCGAMIGPGAKFCPACGSPSGLHAADSCHAPRPARIPAGAPAAAGRLAAGGGATEGDERSGDRVDGARHPLDLVGRVDPGVDIRLRRQGADRCGRGDARRTGDGDRRDRARVGGDRRVAARHRRVRRRKLSRPSRTAAVCFPGRRRNGKSRGRGPNRWNQTPACSLSTWRDRRTHRAQRRVERIAWRRRALLAADRRGRVRDLQGFPDDRVGSRRALLAAYHRGRVGNPPRVSEPIAQVVSLLARPSREGSGTSEGFRARLAWGAGELCSPRTIAGGFGHPPRVSELIRHRGLTGL